MGTFTIACYRPKPGKEDELEALTRQHVPIVEVFEWASDKAIEAAHTNPEVLTLGTLRRGVRVCVAQHLS